MGSGFGKIDPTLAILTNPRKFIGEKQRQPKKKGNTGIQRPVSVRLNTMLSNDKDIKITATKYRRRPVCVWEGEGTRALKGAHARRLYLESSGRVLYCGNL